MNNPNNGGLQNNNFFGGQQRYPNNNQNLLANHLNSDLLESRMDNIRDEEVIDEKSGDGSNPPQYLRFMMNSGVSEQEKQEIIKHIDELKYAEKRDNALLELSRQREHF